MRLKILTSACIVCAAVLMVAYPWLLGPKPSASLGSVALRGYILKFAVFMLALLVCLIGAAIGAIVLLRRSREEYRIEKTRLLKELLEGSLEDHRRTARTGDEQ